MFDIQTADRRRNDPWWQETERVYVPTLQEREADRRTGLIVGFFLLLFVAIALGCVAVKVVI